jgi:DHA1 family tetracycline resistance protein-like MFS transporter
MALGKVPTGDMLHAVQAFSLRLPFLLAANLALASWLYGLFVLPESLSPSNRRPFRFSRANPVGALLAIAKFPTAIGLAMAMFFLHLAQFGLHSTWVLYTEHRYKWDAFAVGISLAIVGLCSAAVQGGLARKLIPRWGEPKSVVIGLCFGVCAYIGYGLATQGWMIYVIVAVASLGAIAQPAASALLSKSVQPDQQGELQGALSSMQSVAQVLAPLAATKIYALSITPDSVIRHPGMSFFWSAALSLVGLVLAARAVRRRPAA